jgi:CheY-like chemotaxis protein
MTKPPILLVVDDEASWRVRLRDLGTSLGFTVVTATDGGNAMEMLEKHPDTVAVITDVRMSPVDGLAVVQYINRMYDERPPKTLLHSGDTVYYADRQRLDLREWVGEYFGNFATFASKSVLLSAQGEFLESVLASRQ